MIIGLLLFLFVFSQPVHAENQPLEDYSFQFNLYLENYNQWQVYKQDYKENPTLDNQQKAILTAKQTISARERSRAALFRYLSTSIKRQAINQEFITNSLVKIDQMSNYHLSLAQSVQAINTPSDLEAFSTKAKKELITSNKVYILAQVLNKLSQLMKYQLEAQRIYELIIPKLPQEAIYPVKNGLDQITSYHTQINYSIEQAKASLAKLEAGEKSPTTFYSETGQILSNIRTQELNLVSILVDLDTNYVTR